MKIDVTETSGNNKILALIYKTILIIFVIIISFNVLYVAGQSLHNYLLTRVYSCFLNENEFEKEVVFSRAYYSSAIYNLCKISYAHYIELELGAGCAYKIEFVNNKETNYIIIDTKNQNITKFLYLIPDYISNKGFKKIIITPIEGNNGFWVKNLTLHNEVEIECFQELEYKIVDLSLKNIYIEIDEDNLYKIAQNRENALSRGILLEEDSTLYPAKVTIEGKTSKIEIRLKGDWVDHLASDKWSFRIEMQENSAWGMVKYSIQSPGARNGIGEYLMHKLYSQYQGVTLNYDYAYVIINGEYWGVYAVEQAFDKIAVENSLKREGPIVKLDESYIWERYAFYNSSKLGFYSYIPFDVFSFNKTVENERLYGYSQYAIELLKEYRNGELESKAVFDMELYAKYLAICDIFQANHALAWHNRRYYFNPITAKLEPITFDMMTMNPDYIPTTNTFKEFFLDQEFTNVYIETSLNIIQNYDEFLSNLQPELDVYLDMISMYNYDDLLEDNRKYINETLKSDSSEFILIQNDSKEYIEILNNSILEICITDIFYDNKSIMDKCQISSNRIDIESMYKYNPELIEIEYLTLFDYEINKKNIEMQSSLVGSN